MHIGAAMTLKDPSIKSMARCTLPSCIWYIGTRSTKVPISLPENPTAWPFWDSSWKLASPMMSSKRLSRHWPRSRIRMKNAILSWIWRSIAISFFLRNPWHFGIMKDPWLPLHCLKASCGMSSKSPFKSLKSRWRPCGAWILPLKAHLVAKWSIIIVLLAPWTVDLFVECNSGEWKNKQCNFCITHCTSLKTTM